MQLWLEDKTPQFPFHFRPPVQLPVEVNVVNVIPMIQQPSIAHKVEYCTILRSYIQAGWFTRVCFVLIMLTT